MKRITLSLVLIVAVFSGCSRGPSHEEALIQLKIEQKEMDRLEKAKRDAFSSIDSGIRSMERIAGYLDKGDRESSDRAYGIAEARKGLEKNMAICDANLKAQEAVLKKAKEAVEATKP